MFNSNIFPAFSVRGAVDQDLGEKHKDSGPSLKTLFVDTNII